LNNTGYTRLGIQHVFPHEALADETVQALFNLLPALAEGPGVQLLNAITRFQARIEEVTKALKPDREEIDWEVKEHLVVENAGRGREWWIKVADSPTSEWIRNNRGLEVAPRWV
jgi:hypothetical protein